MTEDEKSEIYHKGFQAGTEHNTSSPETLKRFSNIEEGLNELLSEFKMHQERHNVDMEKMDKRWEKMEPIIQAWTGARVLGEVVKWLAGVGLAYFAIKQWFM